MKNPPLSENETTEMWRGFRKLGKTIRERRGIELTIKLVKAVASGRLDAMQHSEYHWTVWLPGHRKKAAAGYWPRTGRIRLKEKSYNGGVNRLIELLEREVCSCAPTK